MSQLWKDSRAEYVSRMFGAIADRYDLMNRIMTFGQDGRWRREAAEIVAVGPGERVLDVATGTGDLAFELASRVGNRGVVVGLDFAQPMLVVAERKARERNLRVVFEQGDALNIPYQDSTFDGATCGFGIRNVDDRQRALEEMVRVIRPGRRVVILELTPPQNELARHYMDDIVPRMGQMIAQAREAYAYLPESVKDFPDAPTLGHMMQQAGLRGVTYRLLNFGTIAIHWGEKR